jgi:hypothetical protein
MSKQNVKRELKETMIHYNREYEVSQDEMIDLMEDILLELKTQDFKLPSLENAIENSDL